MYLPIPSAKNKYEIDTRGNVRNARTKYRLKRSFVGQTPVARLYVDGRVSLRSIRQLMWEVHGVEPEKQNYPAVAVWLFRNEEILYFDNMKAAALYLSVKLFYTVKTIRNVFTKRQSEFKGWTIKYCEEEPRIIKSPDKIIGTKYLHRENKYWREKNSMN